VRMNARACLSSVPTRTPPAPHSRRPRIGAGSPSGHRPSRACQCAHPAVGCVVGSPTSARHRRSHRPSRQCCPSRTAARRCTRRRRARRFRAACSSGYGPCRRGARKTSADRRRRSPLRPSRAARHVPAPARQAIRRRRAAGRRPTPQRPRVRPLQRRRWPTASGSTIR